MLLDGLRIVGLCGLAEGELGLPWTVSCPELHFDLTWNYLITVSQTNQPTPQ